MGFFMKRYTVEFKRTVIEHYLTGVAGGRDLSRQYEVPRSLIRRWVRFYRVHGEMWFAKKAVRYSASTKLSVLRHMWENDLSYAQVSAHFDIRSQSAVGAWERSYQAGGFDALEPRPIGRPKKMHDPKKNDESAPVAGEEARTREELLVENRRLRMELEYLKKLDALVQSTKAAQHKKRKS